MNTAPGSRLVRIAACALAASLWLPGSAGAQPASSQPAPAQPGERSALERPAVDSNDVKALYDEPDAEVKRRAQMLFERAVAAHRRLLFEEALTHYQQALALWPHPYVLLATSRTLDALGRPLDAHRHLLRALPGLTDNDRGDAQAFQRILEQKLVFVEVSCDEAGTSVSLDGTPWFVGPGHERAILAPGQHVLVSEKTGYFTVTKALAVPAGSRAAVDIEMAVDRGVIERRRWRAWKPWAALAAGAATSAVGTALRLRASSDYVRFNRAIADVCGGGPACTPVDDAEITGLLARARLESQWGLGLAIAGSVTAVTGLALVYLNQPKSYRDQHGGGANFRLTPMISASAAGIATELSF